MARKIETTVRNAAVDLADAGLSDRSRVTIIVLDEQDEARMADLRRAIADAEATEEIESGRAFAEIRANLDRKHPHRS